MSIVQMLLGEGQFYTIPGNSGIITGGTSYTLPTTTGPTIKILAVAGGGGGGGGSSRNQNWSWYIYGGSGGGSGGNAYATISVIPGSTINFSIGGAGSPGSARDGPYSGGASGSSGGSTTITYNSTTYANASGGSGGLVSQGYSSYSTSPGAAITGTALVTPQYGSGSGGADYGGVGAYNYNINTSVGTALASILTAGSNAAYGIPNAGYGASSASLYGGGGGGGGNNDANDNPGYNAGSGSQGAVFIWWGY